MINMHGKRARSAVLSVLLLFALQHPAYVAADAAVTVQEWADMMLDTYGDDDRSENSVETAYHNGWLTVTAVIAPETQLCRGALYKSAFAAAGIPVYDASLYPGSTSMSAYENCLRIGMELELCDEDAESLELVTRSEAKALLTTLSSQEWAVQEPPILSWFPVQETDGSDLNAYLMQLWRVPEPILRLFQENGWTFAVDVRYLRELGDTYHRSMAGATEPAKRLVTVASPSAVIHELGHFLDYTLGYPSAEGLYDEAESAVFLRKYALTGEREYFAEYFAYYIKSMGNESKRNMMERLTPETYRWFASCEEAGWVVG